MLNQMDWQAILKDHRIYSRMRCLLAVYFMTPIGTSNQQWFPYGMEVASKDIAETMKISRPSVHVLLDALQKERLIHKEHYGRVILTPFGQKRVVFLRKHLDAMTEIIGNNLGTTMLESAVLASHCIDLLDEKRLEEIENMTAATEKDVMTC